jgi:3-mercaptopyruvate sulfurtransferase SseA
MQLIFNKEKKAAYMGKKKKSRRRRWPSYTEDEEICFPKTLVTTYKTTRSQNPEDHGGHIPCSDNLKFRTMHNTLKLL